MVDGDDGLREEDKEWLKKMRKEAKEKQEKQPEKQGWEKEMFGGICGWHKKTNNGTLSFGFNG